MSQNNQINKSSEKENEYTDSTNCNDESIEDLRSRLNEMKRLMSERNNETADIMNGRAPHLQGCGIIDGSFLSVVFTGALIIIITVSVYAFYSLYRAILKKFASHHDEL